MPGGYDTALICTNGHVVNSTAKSYPQFNKKFCKDCGAPTIDERPRCKNKIQGSYLSTGVFGASEPEAPAFCHECGKPYPWTEARLSAAREYIRELDRLDENEKGIMARSLDDLVSETPRTQVAVLRFKQLTAKAGRAASEGLKVILARVIVEAASKGIWG